MAMSEDFKEELRKQRPVYSTAEDFKNTQGLVQLFIYQIREGCGNPACNTPTCYTYRRVRSEQPFRNLTPLSARIAAFYLASQNRQAQICPYVSQSFEESKPSISWSAEPSQKDPKSFLQQLFDTSVVREFCFGSDMKKFENHDNPFRSRIIDKAYDYMKLALDIGNEDDLAYAWIGGAQALLDSTEHNLEHWLQDETVSSGQPLQNQSFKSARCRQIASLMVRLMFREFPFGAEWMERTAESRLSEAFGNKTLYKILYWLHNTRSDILDYRQKKKANKNTKHQWPTWPKMISDGAELHVLSDPGTVLRHWLKQVFIDVWDGDLFVHPEGIAAKTLFAMDFIWSFTSRTSNPTRLVNMNNPHPDDTPNCRGWDQKPFMSYVEERLDVYDVSRRLLEPPDNSIPLTSFACMLTQQTRAKIFRGVCLGRMTKSVEQSRLYIKNINETVYWVGQAAPPLDHLASNHLRIPTAIFLALDVSRNNLVEDTYNQLWRREEREFERPLRLSIKNAGEEGLDQGGVAQEFFRLILAETMDPKYGLFQVDDRTRMTWLDPKSLEPLYKFELLGLLVGLAIYNGFNLPVTFPKAFYAKLLGFNVRSISQIGDGWPELSRGLEQLRDWEDGDVGDVVGRTYEFSFEAYGQVIHVDMTKSNEDWSPINAMLHSTTAEMEAPLVTNANRNAFIEDYIFWLTDKSIRKQFNAFSKGFHSVLGRTSLSMLDPASLQSIVEGNTTVTAGDLESAAGYDGFQSSDRVIRNFWEIVRNEYDNDQRRRLLEFVTASDRLPVNGASTLEFVIQRNGSDTEAIPGAMTCFGRLLLPEYEGRGKLRRKLDIALDNAQGFGVR